MRRILLFVGLALILTPHQTKAEDAPEPPPSPECWWHVTHWHCGPDIIWPSFTTSTTSSTTTSTTSTTTSSSSTTTTTTIYLTTIASTNAPTTQPQQSTSTTHTTVPPPNTSTTQPKQTTTPPQLRPTATTPDPNPTTTTTTPTTNPSSTTTLPTLTTLPDDLTENNLTPEIINQIQNSTPDIRQAFEDKINIYAGTAENYIPLGSTIPVRQRRLLIITGLLVAIPPIKRRT